MQQSQIQNNEEQIKIEQQTEKDECEICFKEIQSKGIFKRCNHYFCINCVLNWTMQQKSCPKCRCKVSKIIKLSISKYPRSKKQKISSNQYSYFKNNSSTNEVIKFYKFFDYLKYLLDLNQNYIQKINRIIKEQQKHYAVILYLSDSESDSSDSDYIPIDTLVGKYGPEDFL